MFLHHSPVSFTHPLPSPHNAQCPLSPQPPSQGVVMKAEPRSYRQVEPAPREVVGKKTQNDEKREVGEGGSGGGGGDGSGGGGEREGGVKREGANEGASEGGGAGVGAGVEGDGEGAARVGGGDGGGGGGGGGGVEGAPESVSDSMSETEDDSSMRKLRKRMEVAESYLNAVLSVMGEGGEREGGEREGGGGGVGGSERGREGGVERVGNARHPSASHPTQPTDIDTDTNTDTNNNIGTDADNAFAIDVDALIKAAEDQLGDPDDTDNAAWRVDWDAVDEDGDDVLDVMVRAEVEALMGGKAKGPRPGTK